MTYRICVAAITFALSLFMLCSKSQAQADQVKPIDFSRFKGMEGCDPKDDIGVALTDILQHQSGFLLKAMAEMHPIRSDFPGWKDLPCYDPVLKKKGKDQRAVRPMGRFAWGLAVQIKTGIYSPEIAGISEEEAIKREELLIRGAAFTHITNTTSKSLWGDDWQSASWASSVAEAAWLLWDHLSDETKVAVVKMLVNEADQFNDYKVPYYADRTGKVIYAGDTKAEENSWNARILMSAVCMLPNHPHVPIWRKKAHELMISAYAMPSDLKNDKIVDGKAVKDWINGSNALDNGLVINHDRIHPDYSSDIYQNCTTALDCSLANVPIPQSTFFNIEPVYTGLTSYKFVPGPSPYTTNTIQPPGGTILHRTADGGYAPEEYFPEGTDWTTVTYDNLVLDVYAKMHHVDQGKDYNCEGWIRARLKAIQQQQNRPGHTGNVYQKGDWMVDDRGFDADTYQTLAEAWLGWWLMQHHMVSPDAVQ